MFLDPNHTDLQTIKLYCETHDLNTRKVRFVYFGSIGDKVDRTDP